MNDLSKARATLLEVGEDGVEQRIDNFLLRRLKGVPKSHVYRVLRSGEVRVNSGRVQPDHRLKLGDRVRVPPVRLGVVAERPAARAMHLPVVHEDEALLVVDKPSGLAVHGGSGVSQGAIEGLRAARPDAAVLELVHRLDRDTSGLLMIAKKRGALIALHRMLREGEIDKRYLALVRGRWKGGARDIRIALNKYLTASGERRVQAQADGQRAITRVVPLEVGPDCSLLELRLFTGRTHQIRVHLAHEGHPVAGDSKYGDAAFNKAMALLGVKRLCLHAVRLVLQHPLSGAPMRLESPLPEAIRALADAALKRAA